VPRLPGVGVAAARGRRHGGQRNAPAGQRQSVQGASGASWPTCIYRHVLLYLGSSACSLPVSTPAQIARAFLYSRLRLDEAAPLQRVSDMASFASKRHVPRRLPQLQSVCCTSRLTTTSAGRPARRRPHRRRGRATRSPCLRRRSGSATPSEGSWPLRCSSRARCATKMATRGRAISRASCAAAAAAAACRRRRGDPLWSPPKRPSWMPFSSTNGARSPCPRRWRPPPSGCCASRRRSTATWKAGRTPSWRARARPLPSSWTWRRCNCLR